MARRQTYSSSPKPEPIAASDSQNLDIPINTATPSDSDALSIVSAISQDTLTPQIGSHPIASEFLASTRGAPAPLNTTTSTQRTTSAPVAVISNQGLSANVPTQRSISMMMANTKGDHGEDSPVMNETLSVIDEHIIDMNTPRSSLLASDHRGINDSGSDYSSHIDHRLSYINGNETDEEERSAHSRAEVLRWSPHQVAQYLKEIGVESQHCEVFKEQEISGEVLLAMDQSSIFMKEFDLGLVGRRLRTWHKIKGFQEEVRSCQERSIQAEDFFGGDASSEDLEPNGNQPRTSNTTALPRIPSLPESPVSRLNSLDQPRQDSTRTASQLEATSQFQAVRSEAISVPSSSTFSPMDSPGRPSAASIRDFNHSRRHSSADFSLNPNSTPPTDTRATMSPSRSPTSPHKKIPSFDRNWTMSGATSAITGRTGPALGVTALGISGHAISASTDRNHFETSLQDLGLTPGANGDTESGYVSNGDGESRKARNVLRKREVSSANHSRQSSHQEEQRNSTLKVSKRHSRFGSADSIRETLASVAAPAAKLYQANSFKGRFRSASGRDSILAGALSKESALLREASSVQTLALPKEVPPPVVTKLDYPDSPATSATASSSKPGNDSPLVKQDSFPQDLYSPSSSKPRTNPRATSDTVAGADKALFASPISAPSPIKESSVQSPTRTGSTTTSGASKSFDFESTDASSKGTNSIKIGTAPTSGAKRMKSKKKTSAYTRGLEMKSPQEQMVGCDYSGWMKKKSPSLMTTWKPRLFVLRGRRLSYYYTENDAQEKGLIDISSHRVLPANNDRLTGLHATVTGAKSSPTSPANAQTPTINSAEVAAQADSVTNKIVDDNMFIFKLVPPRTGLSRAVNFTKPTVHYFAVDNLQQGRLWMAALMKATIDRDESTGVVTTFNQPTISLAKAKATRARPPDLITADKKVYDKGDDEEKEEEEEDSPSTESGLNIQGLNLSYEHIEAGGEEGSVDTGTPSTGDAEKKAVSAAESLNQGGPLTTESANSETAVTN